MKTLILFSTRDGQTREIASYLASELKELGIQADVANVHRIEEPQWENYDRVVIGASIRYGHYHSAFQAFVKKHATQLNSMPSAFYSVNLVARKPEKRTVQTNSYARKFLMNSQWRPDRCAVIAGALRYPRRKRCRLGGCALEAWLSSSVAGHPLRPARDRRLGEPLPHLLANPIWAHPMARGPKVPLFGLATLCGISYRFQ